MATSSHRHSHLSLDSAFSSDSNVKPDATSRPTPALVQDSLDETSSLPYLAAKPTPTIKYPFPPNSGNTPRRPPGLVSDTSVTDQPPRSETDPVRPPGLPAHPSATLKPAAPRTSTVPQVRAREISNPRSMQVRPITLLPKVELPPPRGASHLPQNPRPVLPTSITLKPRSRETQLGLDRSNSAKRTLTLNEVAIASQANMTPVKTDTLPLIRQHTALTTRAWEQGW